MFQQRGKSKFLDFLQKKFYNIDYWKNVFTYWAACEGANSYFYKTLL